MNTAIKLIVGLGNPGVEYANTRHNAGANFVMKLACEYGATLHPQNKCYGLMAQVLINHCPVRLLIPTTFMNLSGKAIAATAHFYRIEPEAILIAHDELDISPGEARLKIGGGHGGHNGLKDAIQSLGNNKQFGRLRLGIGHPGSAKLVSQYVLKKAPAEEQQQLEANIDKAIHIVPLLTEGKWNEAMKKMNTPS